MIGRVQKTYDTDLATFDVTYRHTATIEGRVFVAQHIVSGTCLDARHTPAAVIDRQLQHDMMAEIELQLYGKCK